MKTLIISIILILAFNGFVFADEQIINFEEESVPVLNEILRRIRWDIKHPSAAGGFAAIDTETEFESVCFAVTVPTEIDTSSELLAIVGDETGTGALMFGTSPDITTSINLKSSAEIRFYDNGNYVGFEAPALSANAIWVLPTADGNANDVLVTDGSKTLSFAAGIGAWDVDGNGDLMPKVTVGVDQYWELDGNSDLMPKAA